MSTQDQKRCSLIEKNIPFAVHFAGRYRHVGVVDFDDIVAAAFLGLTRAATTFDENVVLATPFEGLSEKAIAEGRTELDLKFITYARYHIQNQIQLVLSKEIEVSSTQDPLEDKEYFLHSEEESIEEVLIRRDELDKFRDLLASTLTERERRILLMRQEDFTLDQIGLIFNISRERVRQIEKSSMKKVKVAVGK